MPMMERMARIPSEFWGRVKTAARSRSARCCEAVATNQMFAGLGGVCAARNDGDGVFRYDQLAKRWLFKAAMLF